MGRWYDYFTRLEKEKEEEEKRKADREESLPADDNSSDIWTDYQRWKRTGEIPESKKATEEPEEEKPKSLEDRLAARGIQVEMPEPKKTAKMEDTRPTLAEAAAQGNTFPSLFTDRLRNTATARAEEENARAKLLEEERKNQTVRNDEWLSSLRTPEEIRAELDEARAAEANERKKREMLGAAGQSYMWDTEAEAEAYRAEAQEFPTDNAASERVRALEDELAERTWADYERLRNNPDFAEKSQYDEKGNATGEKTKLNPAGGYDSLAFKDPEYAYVNGNEEAGAILSNESREAGEANGLLGLLAKPKEYEFSQLSEMSDEEKALYNYIHATQGKEAAHGYLEYLRSDLYARQAEREKAEAAAYAEEHPVLSTVRTVGMSPLRGAGYLGQTAQYLTEGTVDANAPYNRLSYLTSAERNVVNNTVERSWGKVGTFAYGVGVSMAEFLLNSALAGGGASGVSEALSLTLMGSGAAADATIEAKERGLSDGQSYALGTIAGLAEILTEKISIENLFNGKWETEPLRYLFKNTIAEGSEEAGSDLINWFADVMIAKDKSEWRQAINKYMTVEHMNERDAFFAALKDKGLEILLDAASGALSGFLMAVGPSAKGLAQKNADRSGDIEAARRATQAVRDPGRDRPNVMAGIEQAQQNAPQAAQSAETVSEGIMLPTAEEAETARESETKQAKKAASGTEAQEPRFGTEPEVRTLTPTAEEAETNDAVQKAEAEGNITRATGIRYGIDEKTIRKAENFGKVTGRTVEFYAQEGEGGAVQNGFYDRAKNRIYYNVKAAQPFDFTVAHEFLHSLEGTQEYDDLLDHIKNRYAEQGKDWAERSAQVERLYERSGHGLASSEEVDQEIAADWFGENLYDEKTIREICRETPSAAKRIRDSIDRFVIKAANATGTLSPYEIGKMRNVIGLYDKYLGRAEEARARETVRPAEENIRMPVENAQPVMETVQPAAEIEQTAEAGQNAVTPDELRANAEELYEAGEIDEAEYDEMTALADEMESTGQSLSRSTVERDEGPRGKIAEAADRLRGRYSLSPEEAEQDQREQVESPAFKKWFGDWQNDPENASKVVNPDGTPKIVYHGTARGDRVGNVFLPERATSGPMAYFTDSEQIAANYARDKADTSLAYDEDHDGSYESQFRVQDGDRSIRLVDAWNRLKMRDKQAIREAVKHVTWDEDMENIVYDEDAQAGTGGLQDWRFRERSGNAIAALVDEWLNDGNLYGNEGDFMEAVRLAGIPEALERAGLGEAYYDDPNFRDEKVYGVYLNIRNPLVTTELDESFADALEEWWGEQDDDAYRREYNRADEWDKNRWDLYDWIDRLRSDIENGTTHVWTSIPDAVTDFIKSEGYDGIEDQGGKFHDQGHTVYIPFESTQIKSADPVTHDDAGNVIPLSQRFNPEEYDIRYSVSEADDVRKVKPDMTDEERTEVLRNRTIHFIPAVAEMSEGLSNAVGADGWGTINTLKGNEKRALLHRIAREFGVFKTYSDSDIDLEFEYTGNNFRESYGKQRVRFEQFGKLMSVLDDVIRNAVGIDVHLDEDYKPDSTLDNVYVMMGAFEDGDQIVPVKLAVKEFNNKPNKLYVTVTANGIEKAGVSKLRSYQDSGVAYDSRPANISIAQLMSLVNPADTTLTKYFPEGMRTAEQQAALEESGEVQHSERYSLAEEAERADADYMEAVEAGDEETAQRIVDEAARKAGYNSPKLYHGTDYYKEITVFRGGKSGYLGPGIYLTPNESVAKRYADRSGDGGRIYAAWAKMENPLTVTSAEPAQEILRTITGSDRVYNNRSAKQTWSTQILTRADMKKLRDKGYDGIIWKYGSSPAEYMVFDSNQLKSADPVTYDDDGNVIPLSERFNPENPDIRYSLADDDGAQNDLAGMSQKAKAAALRIERQLTSDVLQGIQRNLNPNSAEFRQFRADVARPAVEAMLRGEEADVDAVLESTGIDIVGQAAARGAVKDAIRRASGELGRIRTAVQQTNARQQAREERNAALDARIPDTSAGLIDLANTVKDARKRWNTVKARTIMTEEDLELAHRIATGQITPEEAFAQNALGMDDIINMAEAEKAFLEANAPWERYVKRLARRRYDTADARLANADRAKDKGNGFAYARETPERNFRDVFGSDAAALIDDYIRPVHTAEAESTRFKNEFNKRVKDLKLDQKIRRGNENSEAAAVQFLGEAEDNIRVLELARSQNATRDGKTLEEWRAEIEAFKKANPNLDYGKVERGIESFRQIYNELITRMNEVLVENGYMPVNVRRGYFPHFQTGDDTILSTFAHLLGINIDTNALPTAINGLTSMFKPGKPWFSHAMERTGFATDYDAIEGFDGYLGGVSDVIHQTGNIRNLRALGTRIRYMMGDEQIKRRIDEIEADETRTEQEKLAAIQDLTDNGRYKLSRFVSWLDEYTNLLANKKSKFDRGVEDLMGRRVYTWMKNIEGRVAANMIAGNLGSALTNFIPLNQAGAVLGDYSLLRGMFDTMAGRARGDGFVNRSDFLTNRRGVDPLTRGGADKIADFLSAPMNLIDNFTSEAIVRAAYGKYVRQGMDPDSAMRAADELAAGLMADRSKGAQPTIFGSHNPLMKLFTQFQVEVNNEFSTIFKDIPKGAYRRDEDRKKLAAVAAWTLLRYFIGAYLFNDAYEKIVGRRAALDPLDLLNDAVGDLTGKKLNNVFDMLTEGVIEEDKPKNPSEGLMNLGQNALEELPFIGGVLGGGRIPISSALPDAETIVKGLTNENWSGAKKAETVGRELGKTVGTYILPPFAGGAGRKLWQTAENTVRGGRYVKDAEGNDQLQYPYFTDTPLETAGTVLQSALFGPTATEGGKAWVEGGFGNQSAKNTDLYKELTGEYGESQRESWNFLQSLRQQDTQGKRMAIAESGLTDEGKAMAMERIMNSGQSTEGTKFRAAYDNGASAEAWAALYGAMDEYDLNGNKQYTQAEIREALDNITVPLSSGEGAAQGLFGGSTETRHLTNSEKAALWSAYNPAWKASNNPYDPKIGERVVSRYNALKGGES